MSALVVIVGLFAGRLLATSGYSKTQENEASLPPSGRGDAPQGQGGVRRAKDSPSKSKLSPSAKRAQTRRQLEMLANSIEEHHAAYGTYPPVARDKDGNQPLRYEYPSDPEHWTAGGKDGAKALAIELRDVPRNEATVFVFGLLSYLECRVDGRASNAYRALFEKSSKFGEEQSHWLSSNSWKKRADAGDTDWNVAVDGSRAISFATRVEPFLNGIVETGKQERSWQDKTWTNSYDSVFDAWSHELRYKSDPPYWSFKIWSVGPDGVNGTADDIVAGKED